MFVQRTNRAVVLVDADRQWFKAKCGIEAVNTPRAFSFGTYAMLGSGPVVVCDATQDSRFVHNPLVAGELGEAKMDPAAKPDDAAVNSGKAVAMARVTDANGVQTVDIRQNKEDYYAHSSQMPGAFKLLADLGKLAGKPLDDFRNKKLFDFGFSDPTKLEIHQPTGDKTNARSGTDWKMGAQTMHPGSVQSVIDKLRDLAASEFATGGFNASDIAITAVSNDGKRTEKPEFSKNPDGSVARREGQQALYKLTANSVDEMLAAVSAIKVAGPAMKK